MLLNEYADHRSVVDVVGVSTYLLKVFTALTLTLNT